MNVLGVRFYIRVYIVLNGMKQSRPVNLARIHPACVSIIFNFIIFNCCVLFYV